MSQYHNKTIFYVVSNRQKFFGSTASWNYFEAGHGNRPCYGVGGSVKKMADEAVRQQKVVIEDTSDFFAWTQQHMSSSSMSFSFVPEQECKIAQKEIEEFGNIKPVPGTMRIHAVAAVPSNPSQVIIRATSCHCQNVLNRSFNRGFTL